MTTGEICVHGAKGGIQVIDPTSHAFQSSEHMAFVADQEVLSPIATCAETLSFSLRLRAPELALDDQVIPNILRDLQLTSRTDTQTRYLSAGERRRLSIAVELVVNPKLIILDEPTSGLDSYNALELLRCLRSFADRGTTILLSIHHPGIEMWNMLDHLILLREGKLMLQTSTAQLPQLLATLGHPMPHSGVNPAEHLIEVSVKNDFGSLKQSGFYDPRFSTRSLAQLRASSKKSFLVDGDDGVADNTDDDEEEIFNSLSFHAPKMFPDSAIESDDNPNEKDVDWMKTSHVISPLAEIRILLVREWRNITRNSHRYVPQLILAGLGGITFAIVFAGAASGDLQEDFAISDFFTHVGALFFFFMCASVLGIAYMSAAVNERPLFEREYRTGHYRIWTYVLSKAISEIFTLLAMAIIVTLIAFAPIGFQGRFWYLALLYYLFGVIYAFVGVLLVAVVKEPVEALNYVSFIFLPNAILSGFYVSVENIPKWIRWMTWAMPFTWTFRLILEEELADCAVPRGQDKYVLQCLDAFAPMLAANEFFFLFDTNATAYLQQTGPYFGADAITEYIQLLTFDDDPTNKLLYDACYVKDMQNLAVNYADEEKCSITIASVGTAFANPEIASSMEPTFVETTMGYRVDFSLDNSNNAVVDFILAKLANPEYDAIGAFANQTKAAQFVCNTLNTSCDEKYFGFASIDECTEAMANLPAMHPTATSIYAGNSTHCRVVHSLMAAEGNADHCPHISYALDEDVNGQYKCTNENLEKVYANHSKKELQSFEVLSVKYGLEESQFRFTVDPSHAPGQPRDECITDGVSTVRSLLYEGDFFSDLQLICFDYTQMNYATSEYRPIYWACVFSSLVVLKILTGFALHRQAHRRV